MPQTSRFGRKERIYHGCVIIANDKQLERDRQSSWALEAGLETNICSFYHLAISIYIYLHI